MTDQGGKKRGTQEKEKGSLFWRRLTGMIKKYPTWLFAPEPKLLTQPDLRDFRNKSDFLQELKVFDDSIKQRKAFHDETSKTIRRVFYALVGASLFCLITVLSKADVALLASNTQVELPILGYKMEYGAFLVLGPLLLIALTFYLHIFVGQHRVYKLAKAYRQPMLPNFTGRTPKIVVAVIFYWMIPLTLAVFTWKAWPSPAGPYLFKLTLGFTAVMFWLQMRRSTHKSRSWYLPLLALVYGLFGVGFYTLTDGRQLDLFKADLSNQDLRGNNLSNGILSEANLSGANLSDVNLNRANLSDAKLNRTNLRRAELNGADLRRAELNGADLGFAELNCITLESDEEECANLSRAELNGANLSYAKLNGALLISAELNCMTLESGEEKCASLYRAKLNGATLLGAKLNGADLGFAELNCMTLKSSEEKCANLLGAELNGATLLGAKLNGANLSEAELNGADLTDADLSGAIIEQSQLDTACGENTLLPPGLTIKPCPPE